MKTEIKMFILTAEQKRYCINNRYNYLVIFPNDTYKGTWTQKHAVRIVIKWNIKHPLQKICSLYDVIPIKWVESRKKQSGIKKLVLYLTGNY